MKRISLQQCVGQSSDNNLALPAGVFWVRNINEADMPPLNETSPFTALAHILRHGIEPPVTFYQM